MSRKPAAKRTRPKPKTVLRFFDCLTWIKQDPQF
jgi:hypothetical protein